MIDNEMIKCIFDTRLTEIVLHVFNLILDKSQSSEIWEIGILYHIVAQLKQK